jgi:hypothetical protein
LAAAILMRAAGRGLLIVGAALAWLPARPAAAQPDWLPPEAAAARRRRAAAKAAVEAADPCADPLLAAFAPPVRDTGLDRGRSACLAGGFAARTRAAAPDAGDLDDSAAIFGELELRWLYLADLELTAGARVVRWLAGDGRGDDDDDETSFGPVYLAAAAGRKARAFGRPLRLAWALRLDLPLTDSAEDAPVVAASPQVAAALHLGSRVTGHARAAALLWLVLPEDDVDTIRALSLSTDLAWAPWRWLAGGIGVEAQSGWHGFALDHLLARGGLRVPLGCRARLELAAAAPLAGREPTDLVVELGLSVDR